MVQETGAAVVSVEVVGIMAANVMLSAVSIPAGAFVLLSSEIRASRKGSSQKRDTNSSFPKSYLWRGGERRQAFGGRIPVLQIWLRLCCDVFSFAPYELTKGQ